MAIREVLVYPNDILRGESEEVTVFDQELKRLVSDMKETMLVARGVGLAAPQIGVLKKVVVIEWEDHKFTLINPQIIEQSGEEVRDEGCLSFPNIYEDVARPTKVKIAYQDENGDRREYEAEGFLARIFSHEIDHLGGKLLIDKLSPIKRTFLKKKMIRRSKSA